MTRSQARLLDTMFRLPTFMILELTGQVVEALAAVVERIDTSQRSLLALVSVLRRKGMLLPEDAELFRQSMAEQETGRAVDAIFEPDSGQSVRDALNRLQDWTRRFREQNRE